MSCLLCRNPYKINLEIANCMVCHLECGPGCTRRSIQCKSCAIVLCPHCRPSYEKILENIIDNNKEKHRLLPVEKSNLGKQNHSVNNTSGDQQMQGREKLKKKKRKEKKINESLVGIVPRSVCSLSAVLQLVDEQERELFVPLLSLTKFCLQ